MEYMNPIRLCSLGDQLNTPNIDPSPTDQGSKSQNLYQSSILNKFLKTTIHTSIFFYKKK